MTDTYRKSIDESVWHFCKNCKQWPKTGFVVLFYPPPSNQLCMYCKNLYQAERCDKSAHSHHIVAKPATGDAESAE